MSSPYPLPTNEARRLEVLRTYEILDTPPEAAFDDIVRLACYMFRTPIAAISFVDDHREWFKAQIGLDLDEASKEGFCAHSVLDPNLFVVLDSHADERFVRNRYVLNPPHVRFYAGAPLFTPEGPIIGALAIVDRKPREFSAEEGRALVQLAHQVQAQLELRRTLIAARKAEAEIRACSERSLAHEGTLVALARSLLDADSLHDALSHIVRQVAQTLNVARVNAWRYSSDRGLIRSLVHYQRDTGTFSNGMELSDADYPSYFEALRANEVIAADDARQDPRTREFTKSYLDPLGISSMLDAPVFVGKSLAGVLCHEHTGPRRIWTQDEKVFAVGAANLVALAIEQWERRAAEEALERSEERRLLAEEVARDRSSFEQLVGKSEPMQEVFRKLRLASQSDVTVLLTGESGTGKELAASAIHSLSERKNKPFVAINCAAIPEALLESELFGHVRGAFTGAVRDRNGLFQTADGGTLFLDEVAELPPQLQVKVLRALQEREVRRVGDERVTKVDVRIIAATNRDLKSFIDSGALRQDFYYRLAVFPIHLPPLRERREDLPLLTEHFVAQFAQERGKSVKGLAPGALRAILAYDWPGNVRELRNALERAFVTVSGDAVTAADLPHEVSLRNGGSPAEGSDQALRERILDALNQCRGSRSKAARLLGVSRVTLWKWMTKLALVNEQR
ncbi:MAG TPA: sigma 54-interacting transcriptional regulator [Planctomycetota bacterium]|nr:sigma 54-interacting transcriptional regulator [Planctomycetota bacterium]